MSTLELEHIKHTSSSSNNLSVHSDGSLTATTLTIGDLTVNNKLGVGSVPNATFGSLLYAQGTPAANKPIISGYSQGNSNNAGLALFNDSGNRGIWTGPGSSMRFTRSYEGNSAVDMNIDSSGRVTMPYQPKFFSYLSGRFPSSGDISGGLIIPFDTTNQNVGSGFDTSNYRYTAPVSGTYVFGMNVRIANNNGIRVARAMIRKNGSQMWDLAFIGGSKSPNPYDHPSLSGVTIIDANANDYFDLEISSELSYAGSLYADPGLRSNFWGYLLG